MLANSLWSGDNRNMFCPYCEHEIKDVHYDHIFSQFLGGRRTIEACQNCNNSFGHSFEGRISSSLLNLKASLTVHGVPLKWDREYRFQNACKVDGISHDFIITRDKVRLVRSEPEFSAVADARGGEIQVRSRREAQRVMKGLQRKYGARLSATINETTTDIQFGNTNFGIDTGPDLARLCLKMCIAAVSTLATFERQHVDTGRVTLLGDSLEMPQVRRDGRSHAAIEERRPPLGHVIYVESRKQSTYGIVQLFGTLQMYCPLGSNGSREACALIGVVDPIKDTETFEAIAPFNVPEAPFISVGNMMEQAWSEKLRQQVESCANIKGFQATLHLHGRPRAVLFATDTASLYPPWTLSEGGTVFKSES